MSYHRLRRKGTICFSSSFLPDHPLEAISGEICPAADETDNGSQIPVRHADQAGRKELQLETLNRVEKIGQPEEGGRKGLRPKLRLLKLEQSYSRVSLQMNEQPTRNYNTLKLIWKFNIFFLTG